MTYEEYCEIRGYKPPDPYWLTKREGQAPIASLEPINETSIMVDHEVKLKSEGGIY